MTHTKFKQYGFGAIEGLIVLMIIVLITGTGIYIWHTHQKVSSLHVPLQVPVTSTCDKTCLETAFQQIKLPSTFTLVSKTWVLKGTTNKWGVAYGENEWHYQYSVSQSQFEQSINNFHKSETGYTFHQLEAGPLIAQNKNKHVEIIENNIFPQTNGPIIVDLLVGSL